MNNTGHVTLHLKGGGSCDVSFRCKFDELYRIELRYSWAGDFLMEQRIRSDRCTLKIRRRPAIFAGWHNIDAWNIRIDRLSTLWVEAPNWWTDDYEASPFLTVMTPVICTYSTSFIRALLDNERATNNVWYLAVPEFSMFTIAVFLEETGFGIERHEKNDRIVASDVLIKVPGYIRVRLNLEHFVQLLHERGVDVEWGLHTYMQSNSIYWGRFGYYGNLGGAGPYLYYSWELFLVNRVETRNDVLAVLGEANRAVRGQSR